MSIKLSGKISDIYFVGNHWAAIAVLARDGRRHKAAGKIDMPVKGYEIELEGDLVPHPVYGEQISVSFSKVKPTQSLEGLKNYLCQFVKGIGPATAEKIIKEFGNKVYSVIENDPEQLTKIPGITSQKAKIIQESHEENKVFTELTEFFSGGATPRQIQKIYEVFGKDSLNVVKTDPYSLIHKVDGIGFQIADKLALASGVPRNSPKRIGAAIVYQLKEIANQGHCFCRVENLEGLLKKTFKGEIPMENIGGVIAEEIADGHLVLVDDDKLYWRDIYDAELTCARCICKMLSSPSTIAATPAIIDSVITDMEIKMGSKLAARQCDAISVPTRNRLSTITGGPGCGKTTVIRGIIQVWIRAVDPFGLGNENSKNIILCAPTGKAARKMTESTGYPASTIHQVVYHMDKIKDALVVVDESSMLDIQLASKLLSRIKNNCNVVFVGDIDQLDPIGPGNFFKDIIQSPKVPTVTLDVSYRQSGIVARNAKKINEGQDLLAYEYDDDLFRFIPAEKSEAHQAVVDTYMELEKKYGADDVLCVVPKRKKGRSQTASEALNDSIQEILNPAISGTSIPGCFFRLHDRVMYTENRKDKDIYNGDCGTVRDYDPATKTVTVEFDGGRIVELNSRDAQNLELAYAMTVHKAQGSEYKAVVISQCWEDYMMLSRSLLYTAVTRAKESVTIVGEDRAIRAALRNVDTKVRNTRLRLLISQRSS